MVTHSCNSSTQGTEENLSLKTSLSCDARLSSRENLGAPRPDCNTVSIQGIDEVGRIGLPSSIPPPVLCGNHRSTVVTGGVS